MKRILCAWMSLVLIFALCLPAAQAADGPALSLSEENSAAGREVELVLSVWDNAGLKGISAEVAYDPAVLTLLSASPKTELGTWDVETIAQDGVLFWYSTESFTGEKLVGLRFRVADNAPLGRSEVSLRFGDWRGLYDGNGDKIESFTQTAGAVVVVEEPEVLDYGSSLSAAGNIGLNTYLAFSDSFLQDSEAYITVDSNVFPVSEALSKVQDGLTLYRFSVDRAAPDMNQGAIVRAFHGDGSQVNIEKGGRIYTDGVTATVRDYLELALQYMSDPKLLDLVKAMSDYGRYAQIHFQRDLDKLAPVRGNVDQVTAEDLRPYAATVTQESDAGIQFYGSSLTVETNTIMRHYFKLNSGSMADYVFLLDEEEVTPRQNGEYLDIALSGIAAAQLDTSHTIRILDGDQEIFHTDYCALSYCWDTLNYTSDEDLLNLVKAIYLYNQAANVYFRQ